MTEREVTAQGLAADRWRPLLAGRPEPDLSQLGEAGRVTIVVPHPDDETLGAGGLLHRLAEHEVRLRAVFVTDGAAGYPGCTAQQAAELAAVRRREAVNALGALGQPAVEAVFLDVPDGTVSAIETSLATQLAPFIADSALCLAPWPHDPHPDHQAVGRAALAAARLTKPRAKSGVGLWQYPIWMRHSLHPDDPVVDVDRLRVLRLSNAELAAKQAAIQAHASQLRSPFPGYGPVLPGHVLELFADGLEPFFQPAQAGAR